MKEKINWFSIFFGLLVVFYATASCIFVPLCAKADVPNSQKVVAHSASWGSYNFSYSFHQKYYTIEDPTGIPSSTLLTAQYFYTHDNVTFSAISSTDLITLVANRGLGLILDPENILNYVQAFLQEIGPNHLDIQDGKYSQGGLYDSQDNFLGYCLNDISGCYWTGINPDSYTIPSQMSNNVYNFNEYYNDNHIDYITVYPLSMSTILRNYNNTGSFTDATYTFLNNLDSGYIYIEDRCQSNGKHIFVDSGGYSNSNKITKLNTQVAYFIKNDTDANFARACKKFKVINNELLMTEAMYDSSSYSGDNAAFIIDPYDSTNSRIYERTDYYFLDGSSGTTSDNGFHVYVGNHNGSNFSCPFNVESFTIYRNDTVRSNIAQNNYYPYSFSTNNYDSYNTTNDNSFQASSTQVAQVITINETIYDNAQESTSNYYDNGYYDNSSATTNITNIYNNYYGSSGGEGGEGGEGGNGSGDNGGSGDSGDSPTWNALMEGLLHFLQAIGDVIGTLIAGLLDIFADILSALSGISESLGSIGTFISQIFTFLPSSLVSILVAAISFCTLCAIIKFIRG